MFTDPGTAVKYGTGHTKTSHFANTLADDDSTRFHGDAENAGLEKQDWN